VGCGALHFYTPTSGEIRSLAVEPGLRTRGIGRRLVDVFEAQAREHDLHYLFALTYVDGFFRKLGFQEVDRVELPLKAWKDCLRRPKFQACDEIAMLKRIKINPVVHSVLSSVGPSPFGAKPELVEVPQFPILR
jgi:amino-acid N-acetyltransferase